MSPQSPRALVMLLAVCMLILLAPLPAWAQAAWPDVSTFREGAPAVRETFREDRDAWTVDSGRSPASSIADGALTIRAEGEGTLQWSLLEGDYSDFYVEVDTAHVTGPIDNMLGIAFRAASSTDFYLYMISSDGMFALGKFVHDEWHALSDWRKSAAIESGEEGENRLGLLASGGQIIALVNNREVARISDESFTSGQIGLVAGANTEGNAEIAFDNFWLWTKPASSSAGWVRKGVSPSPAPTPTRSTSAAAATVASTTANVRSGPSTAYPVVATLQKGDAVDIIGKNADGTWVRIELAGQSQAWVSVSILTVNIDLAKVDLVAVAPPPTPRPSANVAYLVIENHIGRFIIVQINDVSYRVEGKVGDKPGSFRYTLQGTGRYRISAQLPNAGSHNWDLYVEATESACTGREGCVTLGGTYAQTYC